MNIQFRIYAYIHPLRHVSGHFGRPTRNAKLSAIHFVLQHFKCTIFNAIKAIYVRSVRCVKIKVHMCVLSVLVHNSHLLSISYGGYSSRRIQLSSRIISKPCHFDTKSQSQWVAVVNAYVWLKHTHEL